MTGNEWGRRGDIGLPLIRLTCVSLAVHTLRFRSKPSSLSPNTAPYQLSGTKECMATGELLIDVAQIQSADAHCARSFWGAAKRSLVPVLVNLFPPDPRCKGPFWVANCDHLASYGDAVSFDSIVTQTLCSYSTSAGHAPCLVLPAPLPIARHLSTLRNLLRRIQLTTGWMGL